MTMEFKYPFLRLSVHVVLFSALLNTHAQSSKYIPLTTSLAKANTPSQVSHLQKYNVPNKSETHDQINLAGRLPIALSSDESEEPQSKSLTYIIVLNGFACIITPMTIFGNLLVIIAVIKEIRKGKQHNVFILSQAAGDFLCGVVVQPFYVYYSINTIWELGIELCYVFLLVDWLIIFATHMTIFAIAGDIYLKQTATVRYWNWRTDRKISYIILGIWIFPFVTYLPAFLLIEPTSYVHEDTVCVLPLTTDMWFSFIWLILQYWIPTFIKIYFYWKIYTISIRTVKQSQRSLAGEALTNTTHQSMNISLNNTEEDQDDDRVSFAGTTVDVQKPPSTCSEYIARAEFANDPRNTIAIHIPSQTKSAAKLQERKIMVTVGLIVIVFVVLNTPYAILLTLPPFCGTDCTNPLLYEVFFGFAYINSAINPFLYAGANDQLWASIKQIARFRC